MPTATKRPTAAVPAGAKKPQDHKPKTEAPEKPSVTEKDGGYKVVFREVPLFISPDAVNDYELVEDLAEQDAAKIPSVLRRLFGDEGYLALKEALRDPDTGRVPLEGAGSVSEFVEDLFEAINPS